MNCNRFYTECDSMRGFWGFKCMTAVGGRSQACKECYRQARAKKDQCLRQGYQDDRTDEQDATVLDMLKYIGIGLAGLFLAWLILK